MIHLKNAWIFSDCHGFHLALKKCGCMCFFLKLVNCLGWSSKWLFVTNLLGTPYERDDWFRDMLRQLDFHHQISQVPFVTGIVFFMFFLWLTEPFWLLMTFGPVTVGHWLTLSTLEFYFVSKRPSCQEACSQFKIKSYQKSSCFCCIFRSWKPTNYGTLKPELKFLLS